MVATALTHGTLIDYLARKDPDGSPAVIAEVLTRKQAILEDWIFKPTNKDSSHVVSIRSGLPTTTLRKYYAGITKSKSKVTQVTEMTAQAASELEVDYDEAVVNGMESAWFASEADAFLESMARKVADQVFYGTQATEDGIVGLAPRFNTASTDYDSSGYNIINGGGASTDNTSVWFLKWDPANLFGLFPKNTSAGIQVGQPTRCDLYDASGNRFDGIRQTYKWNFGLCVKNFRNVVRIANIKVGDLSAGTGTMASQALLWMLTRASERFDSTDGVVLYVNRRVRSVLRKMILEKAANNLTFETVAGKRVIMFDGMQVKLCDSLVETEATVAGSFSAI
jgi:hypothetical protein